MKVVVTGGCGFIGGHVTELLVSRGMDVLVLDNMSSNKNPHFVPNVRYSHDNILDERTHALYEGAACVFHLAAYPRVQPSIDNPAEFHVVNVDGTHNVLEACRKNRVRKVVFSSSSSVYGNPEQLPVTEAHRKHPMSPYALHKLIGEQYLDLFHELYGIDSVSLRYFNVYGDRYPTVGPYVPVVGIFLRQLASREPLTVTGDGTQSRDFVNVKDVAMANLLSALDKRGGCHVYNVGTQTKTRIIDIARFMSDNIKFIEPRYEYKDAMADISLISAELGWKNTCRLFDWISEKSKK